MELIDSGVVPRGTDYNLMDTRFNRGEVATMISGPGHGPTWSAAASIMAWRCCPG